MKAAVIFGSTTGFTESVAGVIAEKLGGADLKEVSGVSVEDYFNYDLIILGSSTWGIGDLQDDWEEKAEELKNVDFSGKTVALFGTGDQEGYPDSFVDAIGKLYTIVTKQGARVIGKTKSDGYTFDVSEALIDGVFTGLVIDEDNQSGLTDERVSAWVEQLKAEL